MTSLSSLSITNPITNFLSYGTEKRRGTPKSVEEWSSSEVSLHFATYEYNTIGVLVRIYRHLAIPEICKKKIFFLFLYIVLTHPSVLIIVIARVE